MYLARLQKECAIIYQLRTSYQKQECFHHKIVFDFGSSPDNYFEIENRTVIFSNTQDRILFALKDKTPFLHKQVKGLRA